VYDYAPGYAKYSYKNVPEFMNGKAKFTRKEYEKRKEGVEKHSRGRSLQRRSLGRLILSGTYLWSLTSGSGEK
jgi:hypothetical protein